MTVGAGGAATTASGTGMAGAGGGVGTRSGAGDAGGTDTTASAGGAAGSFDSCDAAALGWAGRGAGDLLRAGGDRRGSPVGRAT